MDTGVEMRSSPLCVALCAASALPLAASAEAATLQVGPTRTYATIGAAVAASTSGDTVEVDAGTYVESLDLTKDLVFVGLGGRPEIRGTNTAIRIRDARVEFHSFEVTNTTTGQGFSLDNGADVLLEDVFVHDHDNTGTVIAGGASGGALWSHNSEVEIVDCAFDANSAREAGGHLFLTGSTATVTDSTFDDGRAGVAGAIAVRGASTVTIDGSAFAGNQSQSTGGAIHESQASTLTVTDTTFTDNQTVGTNATVGGALAILEANTKATIQDSTFTANAARTSGGAIAASVAALSTEGCVFDANLAGADGVAVQYITSGAWSSVDDTFKNHVATSGRNGGAVAASGSVIATFDGTVFQQNSANRGGAIAYTGSSLVTVLDGLFDRNTAVARSGAIEFTPSAITGALTVIRGRFVGNAITANGGQGGAIGATVGTVTLTDVDFTTNRASSGGAVYGTSLSMVTVTGGTYCANAAEAGNGGGLYVIGPVGRFDVKNVVFAENTATQQGGGLYVAATATASVVNNTFAGNAATTNGAASYFANTGGTYKNNLVRGSAGSGVATAGSSVATPALTYDLWFQNSPNHTGEGLSTFKFDTTHQVDVAPQLGPWTADKDCTNDDWKPVFGSPVIDKGDPALLDPDGSRSDIGAFGGPSASKALFTDADNDGYKALVDCDDGNVAIHPGASETCNTVDDDCDGTTDENDAIDASTVYADTDGDGYGDKGASSTGCPYGALVADKTDCDDKVASTNPGAGEVCNLRDDDCDGVADDTPATGAMTWYADTDGDGWGDSASAVSACFAPPGAVLADGDCDDTDDTRYPGGGTCDDGGTTCDPDAVDECDGVDDDCDGITDEDGATTWYADADGDGYGNSDVSVLSCDEPAGHATEGTDCDDAESAAHPDAAEIWYDGIDEACDGGSDHDQDGDGRDALDSGGQDCDDTDPAVFGGADDPPGDGVDQDCSGADGPVLIDTGVDTTPGKCGCATSGATPGYALAVALITLRLRRRRIV